MLAAQKGHRDLTRLLIDNKARVDVSDHIGLNALHKVAATGHIPVLKFLMGQTTMLLSCGDAG